MDYVKILIEKLKNGNNSVLKNLYGSDEEVLLEQAERYLELLKKFELNFQNQLVEVFSSPGRLEIAGYSTNDNLSRVLAVAVNIDNIAVAAVTDSNKVNIISTNYPQFEVDLSELYPDNNEYFSPASLVRGICACMKELGFAIGGFNAVIDSEVPEGSGLGSSASFEVLIGTIISHLFNNGKLDPITNALIGQYAENNFFGKPCGLMDQTTCATGGIMLMDFENTTEPVINKVNFDFDATGFTLVITNTRVDHSIQHNDYNSIPLEMQSIALKFGGSFLSKPSLAHMVDSIPTLRESISDHSILNAFHCIEENQRALRQAEALEGNDFQAFLQLVNESGNSSLIYNQNLYNAPRGNEQGASIAFALSEMLLKEQGACRVQSGGDSGIIQAFVPQHLLEKYIYTLEHVFGEGACKKLFIRNEGSVKVDFSNC